MLTLFTNITEQMTDLEKSTLVPRMLEALRMAHGTPLKSKWICALLGGDGYAVTDVRVRKMVNYIRVTNAAKPFVLIGTSAGYFLTRDIKTVDDQIESLEGRIDSMKAAIDSIKSQRLNLLHQ